MTGPPPDERPATVRSIREFAPAGDGETLDTSAFQAAVDALAAAGGGTLRVGAGRYLLGSVRLASRITVRLEAGAELIASPDVRDYPLRVGTTAEQSDIGLLTALNATDIAIEGPGTIDGNACRFFAATPDAHGYRIPAAHRPRMIVLEGCTGVRLAHFTVRQAPMWTVHLVTCAQVTVQHITVDNDLTMSNTDAVNLDSCTDVQVAHCSLRAGDDGICVKTTAKPVALRAPSRRIRIEHCTITSLSCAIKIGTETVDDVDDVEVAHCVITRSNRAIGVFSRDGGRIRNIRVHDVVVECRLGSAAFWGKADPVFVSARSRDPLVAAGPIENLRFTALTGTAEGAINLHAELPGQICGVVLEDIHIEQRVAPGRDQGWFDLRPPVNPDNPTGAGLDNAHRIEPDGSAWGVERYPGGLPGVYATGVLQLTMRDVTVRRPAPLPHGWNEGPVAGVVHAGVGVLGVPASREP